MSDENFSLVLLQIICLLMFSCGFVAFTQHPEWFGAPDNTAAWQYSMQSAGRASHVMVFQRLQPPQNEGSTPRVRQERSG
jgi:hypothetical protein